MSEPIIIGVDHGYAAMKTAHFSFHTGLVAHEHEPYQEAERYTKRLLSAIAESGLDVRAMPAVFLGGGATLLKHHASAADGLCRPIILDDVCLNAKGYERLTERMSKKHEQ